MSEQTTLRDQLASAVDTFETEQPVEIVKAEPTVKAEVKTEADPVKSEPSRVRDVAGKFATTAKEAAPVAEPVAEPIDEQVAKPIRPSSWKKELWNKYDNADPDLQKYILQRESEATFGVSTYRAEAEKARPINDAMAPFMGDLQKNNIEPATWIKNLGAAHQTLALGSPAQKYDMFQRLARDYGVDLSGNGQSIEPPQIDQQTQWLTQKVNAMSQNWDSFQNKQQVTEQQVLQSEISTFADKNPHFETVRDTMAGLLQAGMAQDLQTAYDKAIRLNDDVWQQEQTRSTNTGIQAQVAAAAKAKTLAISPKSATPSGTKTGDGKGLREQLRDQFDAVASRV